jgi:glycosyltransferase involved in cell wall biosynthesis
LATPHPKYSVCITNYNKGEKVRTSLESLLPEIDERFEIVVTDNLSNDGSEEILREYTRNRKIKLLQKKCSRGMGRRIAFENANGEYIVSGIDTDDVVIPNRLPLLLDFYHKRCEGNLLRVMQSGIVVAPAELVRKVGEWRDLQFSENWDIAERAARIDKYVWTIFRVKDVIGLEKVSIIKKNKLRYTKYLDRLRLKRRLLDEGEKFGLGKSIDYILARISLLYYGHLNSARPNFNDYSPEFFVDSSKWWHRAGQDEKEEIKWYSRLLKKTPDWDLKNIS